MRGESVVSRKLQIYLDAEDFRAEPILTVFWMLYIVKYLSPATSTAIIRCPRESYRLVWAALTYMSRLPGNKDGNQSGSGKRDPPIECVFRVVRVSGTMKKAEQEAIRRARLEVAKVSNYWEAQGKDILQEMFPGSTMAIGIESEGGDEEDDGSDT